MTSVSCTPAVVQTLRLEVFRRDGHYDDCGWQLRVVVDDLTLTDAGCGMDPDELLPDGLRAEVEPRRVTVVRCGCSDVGCSSASVSIRRDGDVVVWEDWESSHGSFEEHRFDAGAYDAELRRAHAHRPWEPEVRRVARTIRELVTPELVDGLAAHGLRDAQFLGTERDTVEVWFEVRHAEHEHWQVFLDVSGMAPEAAVELLGIDPSGWPGVRWHAVSEHPLGPPPMAGPDWTRGLPGW